MANNALYINCTANTEHPWTCLTITPLTLPYDDVPKIFQHSAQGLLNVVMGLAALFTGFSLLLTVFEAFQIRRDGKVFRTRHGPEDNVVRIARMTAAIASIVMSGALWIALLAFNVINVADTNVDSHAYSAALQMFLVLGTSWVVLAAIPLFLMVRNAAIEFCCTEAPQSQHYGLMSSSKRLELTRRQVVWFAGLEMGVGFLAQGYAALMVVAELEVSENPGALSQRLLASAFVAAAVAMVFCYASVVALRRFVEKMYAVQVGFMALEAAGIMSVEDFEAAEAGGEGDDEKDGFRGTTDLV